MPSRPNVLILMSDQHNASVAGFAGDAVVRTPTLDALARRGVCFDRAYCQSPVCTPSRASFLTGKYVSNLSCWNNHWVIFPEHLTLPQHFADAGYETCLVGKMHFGGKDQFHGFLHRPYGDFRHGLGHQPDPIEMFPSSGGVAHAGPSQIPESLQQENVVTAEAAAWILEHQANRPGAPWLLCASYCKPHAPLVAPSRYLKRYEGHVPPAGQEKDDEAARHPYPARQRENYALCGLSPEQHTKAREAYWAAVEFLDDCIGALLWRLERAGALDNTVVVYTSDHGDLIGNHGLWWKANWYEEAVRVPLLIAGPGVASGVRRSELAELNDLFPTLCRLCGLDVPEGLDGVDASALLGAASLAEPPRSHAISEFFGMAMLTRPYHTGAKADAMRMIRTERYKYADLFGMAPLLFDLEADPREFRNAAHDPALEGVANDLAERLGKGFDWQGAIQRIEDDRCRAQALLSGQKPTTPNQYRLSDGRLFDAEGDLYGARWLQTETRGMSGHIPQRWG